MGLCNWQFVSFLQISFLLTFCLFETARETQLHTESLSGIDCKYVSLSKLSYFGQQ